MFFKKLFKRKNTKAFNNPEEVLVNISNYAPDIHLRPADYYKCVEYSTFMENFEKDCKESLKSISNLDEYNSTYMDQVIEKMCDLAISDLKIQREYHIDTIHKLVNKNGANYVYLKSKLEDTIKQKEKNDERLEVYKRIYYKDTSFMDNTNIEGE